MSKYLHFHVLHTQKGKPKRSLSPDTDRLWKDLPIVIKKQGLQTWQVEAAPYQTLSLSTIHAVTVAQLTQICD